MSVVFSYHDVDPCDLKWWSASTVVPGGGQYQFDWSVQRAGQPIAFTIVQQDGLPASATIQLSGTEYIKSMQVGPSAIYTTADLPYLERNARLTILGQGTAGGTLTFTLLLKHTPNKGAS